MKKTLVCICTLLMAACKTTERLPSAQLNSAAEDQTELAYSGYQLGQGYNTYQRDATPSKCMEKQDSIINPGSVQETELKYITDREDIEKTLDLHLRGKYANGAASGKASVKYHKQTIDNEASMTFFFHTKKVVHSESLVDPIKAERAKTLNSSKALWDECGDSYVSTIEQGGSIYGYVKIQLADKKTKEKLELSASARSSLGSVNTKITNTLNTSETKGNISIEFRQVGGSKENLARLFPDLSNNFKNCDLSKEGWEECSSLIANIHEYALSGFPSGLTKENAAVVGFKAQFYYESFFQPNKPYEIETDIWESVYDLEAQIIQLDNEVIQVKNYRNNAINRNNSEAKRDADDALSIAKANRTALLEAYRICAKSPDDCIARFTGIKNQLRTHGMEDLLTDATLVATKTINGVTITLFEKKSESSSGHHVNSTINLPDAYVAIGGGVVGSRRPGTLLVSSYPNKIMSQWIVSTKDQGVSDLSDIHTYAIGLKIAKMSRKDLLSYIKLRSNVTSVSHHPHKKVAIPNNYLLIGGGARAIHDKDVTKLPSNLLTGIYPETDGGKMTNQWIAQGKDHKDKDPSSLEVYAIGISREIGDLQFDTELFTDIAEKAQHPSIKASVTDDYLLTGCGARVHWKAPQYGAMIWKLEPTHNNNDQFGCTVGSKDHQELEFIHLLTGYAIGLKPTFKDNNTQSLDSGDELEL